MKNVLIVSLLAACLAGCAGTKFDFDQARQVKVGMTKQEVETLMGRPYMVTTKGEQELWTWSYANGMTGTSRAVTFTFKDDKVVGVPKIPDSF